MNTPLNQRLFRLPVWGPLLLGAVGLVPLVGLAQSTPAVAPNVIFLLDTHRSMQDFPIYLPEATSGSSPSMSSVVTDPQPGDPGYNDPKYGHFIDTGCSDPALVAEMSWFDKNSPDPAKNGSIAQDADPDLGSTFFDSTLFYHSRGRRVSWNGFNEDFPFSMSSDFRTLTGQTSASTACHQVWNTASEYRRNPVLLTECTKCLMSKGWWRGPLTPPGNSSSRGMLGPPQYADEPTLPREARRKWIVSGGVLNLRPPRFVTARRVLKDVLQTANTMRMGVATFGEDRGWFDPAWVLSDVLPLGCSASSLPLDEAQLDRPALMKAVNRALFRHNERQTGESLFSLGAYFSSQGMDRRWSSWFAQPLGPPWGWPGLPKGGTVDSPFTGAPGTYGHGPDEWLKAYYQDPSTGVVAPGQRFEQGGNNRSVCFYNQVNAVVVVTVGEPVSDNSVPITKMMSLLISQNARHETPGQELVYFNAVDPRIHPDAPPGGVNYCNQFEKRPGVMATAADCDYTEYNWPTGLLAGNKNFMDDTAFFLSHMDLRGDLSGTQRMRTYVVGYGSSHPMLQSIARAGLGSFRRADDATTLRAALEQTLAEIRAASP